MGKRGRPQVLDKDKRARIVAIISVGCSQGVAAQYAGCAPSTIRKTAERDPTFAEELRQAKCNAELSLIKNIRNAAKKEQYWRGRLALERGFPEKYARRGHDTISFEQFGLLLAKFADIVVQEVDEEKRKIILKKLDALARELGIELKREAEDETS